MPAQNLSGLEQQLRHITTQIETLRPSSGLEEGIAALRLSLGEIARTLLDAMPKRAIEALETEVRTLAGRLDNSRNSGVDAPTLSAVEHGLAEIRDTLRALTPAENLDGFREAVRSLAQKLDVLGTTGPDPAAFQQLESAISALRGIVSHVASNEALAQLAGEVHALAQKIDHVATSGGVDTLAVLEKRIAHISDALEARAQSGGSIPPQLEAVIKGLSEKIERLQLSRGDHVAVGHLEDRIVALVEKLDASGARFSQLEAIERGLADLLVHVEAQRGGAGIMPPNVEGMLRDMARTQTSLEAVHGTLGHVVDRLATLETDMRGGQPRAQPRMPQAAALPPSRPIASSPPAPDRAMAAAQAAAAMAKANPKTRAPIDPNLPPDQPLEPGSSSGSRARLAASPADRIAASEAALGRAKPPVIPDPGGKSNFIAAARRAAQAAAADPSPADLRAAAAADQDAPEEKPSKTLAQRVRSLFVGASVILIVGGSLRIAANLFDAPNPPAADAPASSQATAPAGDARTSASFDAPKAPTPAEPKISVFPERSTEVTGSVRPTPPPAPPSLAFPSGVAPKPVTGGEKLPVAIGGTPLRTAAMAGNAAAQYEVGIRYAEGRGVPVNSQEAAKWLEFAAKQNLPLAQFRLAGLYEKGIGVKKDVETARRLYKSAAEQGNAKAMHNLAVLYAEGAAVKPDYRTAAQWFRLAADHGVADSQYNLAILYARGIGVDQNLSESYKWFALAAAQGDQDAASKRDDVAKRLDPASLTAARLAAEAFKPQPQPDAATTINAPPGGWDAAASGDPVPPKPKPRAAGPVRLGSR
jgi:localization factor PodJL